MSNQNVASDYTAGKSARIGGRYSKTRKGGAQTLRSSTTKAMKAQSVKKKGVTRKKALPKSSRFNGNNSPHGRKEIIDAILKATERLLPKHNPADISLRQIAEAANVNYSLIHRYFGTKESVIMAAHERIIDKVGEEFSEIDRIDGNVGVLFKMSGENVSRRMLLARAMLDGADPHLIRYHFPIMNRLVELLRRKKSECECPTEYDAETLAAFFAASSLGWFFFEPFLLYSTGLDKRDRAEVHKQITEILEKTADLLC